MAFDGITVAALVAELSDKLRGGRISKIIQPEKDELLLTIKSDQGQFRLLVSTDASLPLLSLVPENKKAPMTAPAFCMLLRKHIAGGRILSVTQPGLERIAVIEVEHLNEMGDLCQKKLIVELMGKHSNLIFCDDQNRIIDSIKHISALVSSVREVLPGKEYFIVKTQEKEDLTEIFDAAGEGADKEAFKESVSRILSQKAGPLYKIIYQSFTGISPVMAQEICYRAGVDGDRPLEACSEEEKSKLLLTIYQVTKDVKEREFSPCLFAEQNGNPIEFAAFPFSIYQDQKTERYESMSELLELFYGRKAKAARIRQKSADLRHITSVALERQSKKLSLQQTQLKDTEKRDKYRKYGELLHTYGYQAKEGDKSLTVTDYETGEDITIPLDQQKSPMENAAAFFERYGKLKRTFENLTTLIEETRTGKEHLESIMTALELAEDEEDLAQIRQELMQTGYIRQRSSEKRKSVKSHPLHFVNADGYDLYVGKNNFQNDEITFGLARGNDWWFHAKKIPGSHVVLKVKPDEEVPDGAFEDAARLAAHFSAAKGEGKIEVDYIQKKHVKKPAGANPGFVVYYTNYSMVMDGDISGLTQITE